jgi:acetyl esterase/lipase
MKPLLIFVFSCTLSFNIGHAQVIDYAWETDVSYSTKYSDNSDYALEKKKLEIGWADDVPKDLPIIIWFHGGGLTSGNNKIPNGLKRKGYIVVSVDYRQAPNVPAEEIINDAVEAIAWTMVHAQEYGGDPSKVFVAGHSAGGYLAMMSVLDKKRLELFGIDAMDIAGVIPFSGHTITHFQIRKERGIPKERALVDEFAPLYYVSAEAPPMLLITGDRDKELLGRYEENAYFQRMMKVAGNNNVDLLELDGYGHLMTEPAFPLLFEFVDRVVKN